MPQRFADRCAAHGTRRHAAVAFAVVLAAAYAALTTVMVTSGLLLMHALPSVTHGDERDNVWVAAHRSGFLTHLADWGGYIADTMGVVVVASIVTVILLVRRRGRLALLVPAALGLELSVFLTTNYTVGRPRPTVPHLGHTPSTASFPSGHVAATLALYGGIAVLVTVCGCRGAVRAIAWGVALLFPAWVAFCRVYQGQHHPLDVVGGLIVGFGSLVAAVVATRTSFRSASAGPASVTAQGDAAVAVAEPIGAHR